MEFYDIIGSYAFPIVMCLWFMFRTENTIKDNTKSINNLSDVLEKCYYKKE